MPSTDRVVSAVTHQTSPKQPDRIRANKIVLVLAEHGALSSSEVREALDEAVESGRLGRDEDHVWLPE